VGKGNIIPETIHLTTMQVTEVEISFSRNFVV